MIRIIFPTFQRPTDIVIRDGNTYVSVAPVDNAMWAAIYEEIEVLRGKDYDPAGRTYGSTSGRYSQPGGYDPYRFTRQRRYFDESSDDRVKPDPIVEEVKRQMMAGVITKEQLYANLYGRDDGRGFEGFAH